MLDSELELIEAIEIVHRDREKFALGLELPLPPARRAQVDGYLPGGSPGLLKPGELQFPRTLRVKNLLRDRTWRIKVICDELGCSVEHSR